MVFPGLKLTFQLQLSVWSLGVLFIYFCQFFPGAVVGVSFYSLPVVTSFESECEGLPVFCFVCLVFFVHLRVSSVMRW